MKSPFKFLDAFNLSDKAVFFGRDQEIEDLYQMVYQSNLILVYGYSGTGKTSLIQCGLASRFDGPQWYPFFIRKGEDINQSIRTALSKALKEDPPEDLTLVEMVEEILDEYLSPVYLIFDQFEELFILGTPDEQAQFTQNIQNLIKSDLSCKIIFTIREEYLGELYQLEKALPTLSNFKFRVETINKIKVEEILRESFKVFNILLEKPAEDRLEEIIANVSLEKTGILLPFLQVYLDQLYRKDYQETFPDEKEVPLHVSSETRWPELTFTKAEIKAFGTMKEVFPRFLEAQKKKILAELIKKYPDIENIEEKIRETLDVFATSEGTKRPIPFQLQDELIVIPPRIEKKFIIKNPLLTDIIRALENSRILRVRDGSYELFHDSLAELIDKRRTDEQRQLNEAKKRLENYHLEFKRTAEYPTIKQLISIEEFTNKLTLDPHLLQFLQKSYTYNEEQEIAKERKERQKDLILHFDLWRKNGQYPTRYQVTSAKAKLEGHSLEEDLQQFLEKSLAYLDDKESEEEEGRKKELNKEKELRARAEKNERNAQRSKKNVKYLLYAALGLAFVIWGFYVENKFFRKEASDTLRQLQDYTLLTDAYSLIEGLDYSAAFRKMKKADDLKRYNKEEVGKAMMEIAFFHTESQNYDTAWIVTAKVAELYGDTLATSLRKQPNPLRTLRDILNRLDSRRYQILEERYFPEMVVIKGGTFWMGRGKELDKDGSYEVKLDDFRLARTETTVWQYHLFMVATKRKIPEPSEYIDNKLGDQPIRGVSWYEALAYSNWLSQQRGKEATYHLDIPPFPNDLDSIYGQNYDWEAHVNWKANGFRLPTEAEWEYAARGGNQQDTYIYSGSDSLHLVAWYGEEARDYRHSVSEKQANRLGLYDMSGNVWEWCWDRYSDGYPQGRVENPHGPIEGEFRVSRGGSYIDTGKLVQVTYSDPGNKPIDGSFNDGFRIAQGF